MANLEEPVIVLYQVAETESAVSPSGAVRQALRRTEQLQGLLEVTLRGAQNVTAQQVEARFAWGQDYLQQALAELALAAQSAEATLLDWGIRPH